MNPIHRLNGDASDNRPANIQIVNVDDNLSRPMSLSRVKIALKESYKCAPCGTWIETWYFDGLLAVILIERDALGKVSL